MTKARDIADFKFENITDTGTEGTKVAAGTTAQRGSTTGQIRFNSTTGLAEYYTGTAFKSIDEPPTVSSIDITEVDSQAGGNQTIVITGSGFNSGATVTFVGNAGTDFNASTVTVNSATQITAVAPKSSFLNAQEPYGVKVTNVSGLANTLASQINVDTSPSWSTASGTLATINDNTTGTHATVSATDPDGDTVAYSETTSVLSGAGFSLNSSTGEISGDPTDVSGATTNTFTLRATANSKTADRSFNIVVNPAPIPVQYLLVAGGGSGGTSQTGYHEPGGGGGAGGLLAGNTTLTKNTTYSFVIGLGGNGTNNPLTDSANNGGDTTGLSLTAIGGGKGTNRYVAGSSGGSGGGKGLSTGGYAGTSGQGNAGGGHYYSAQFTTAGAGGGAGSVGGNGISSRGGNGGSGISNSITGTSITYAGGGGGSGSGEGGYSGGSGGSGGGGNGNYNGTAGNGTDGLGGGGGGTHRGNRSGDGGNGVAIIRVATAQYTGTYTGTPTITTVGSDTVLKFLANGSYTA